ncbi:MULTISPECIES: ribonuclease D [Hyphomonas]|jgi:ribonuclease D|uniref:ribonuclease D n=1 Tax=Hyphomonas TaxID=85 RepID=UPI000B74DA7E|nr:MULTISPECIES: ribonuclease H-like domain-containing protein [Hyphomonas]MAH93758.1 ribonuclease D [Hyphomonas sp.]OUX84287.1 MAG: ribonuclease D [Hyphomonas sp. TMED31]HBF90636.1 ribonuclease D [Hyphomonas atlantica]HBH44890.1 ribonuclease D [Hyphomonas atlantica]
MNGITLHKGDLPAGLDFGPVVAVDTEAMGLNLLRDNLTLVQLSSGDGTAHLVQLDRDYDCPNLKQVLTDPNVLKLFHFARFDVAMMKRWMGIDCAPIWCTKIASKLARTYTDRHGLKDVAREIAGADMSKAQQSSDWGSAELTDAQLQYAASDVLYLHKIKDGLEAMLKREGRLELAEACFAFLPIRATLDLSGWDDVDIFAHS